MEPTTGASPYQQAAEQHIRRRQQSNPQHRPLEDSHSAAIAQAALEAHLSQHQQQALAAIQDLEHQRLQMWSQDLGANPHR